MNRSFIGFAAVTALAGCYAAPAGGDVTAEVDTDVLDTETVGQSYLGWYQTPSAYTWPVGNGVDLSSIFTRSSGDSTRGGGACVVYKRNGTTCSGENDTPCITAAQSQFGTGAHGYCWQNACYSKLSDSHCVLSPNRSPGTLSAAVSLGTTPANHSATRYAYGCMTKTAGPNYACKGSDPSLYMRYLTAEIWIP